MSEVELRIPLGLGERLQDLVYREGRHEYVAFGLVGQAWLQGRQVLLLRHVMALPEEDYLPNSGHGAAWKGRAMMPVIEQAMNEGLGILLFHAHPHFGCPAMSSDDQANAARLIPVFQQRVPTRPHGSVVLSKTHASGILMMPREAQPRTTLAVRWYGAAIRNWPASDETPLSVQDVTFHRQALVVGDTGQEVLRRARVAVVGLGGGGAMWCSSSRTSGSGTSSPLIQTEWNARIVIEW